MVPPTLEGVSDRSLSIEPRVSLKHCQVWPPNANQTQQTKPKIKQASEDCFLVHSERKCSHLQGTFNFFFFFFCLPLGLGLTRGWSSHIPIDLKYHQPGQWQNGLIGKQTAGKRAQWKVPYSRGDGVWTQNGCVKSSDLFCRPFTLMLLQGESITSSGDVRHAGTCSLLFALHGASLASWSRLKRALCLRVPTPVPLGTKVITAWDRAMALWSEHRLYTGENQIWFPALHGNFPLPQNHRQQSPSTSSCGLKATPSPKKVEERGK